MTVVVIFRVGEGEEAPGERSGGRMQSKGQSRHEGKSGEKCCVNVP